jgi:hydroxymethylpyrimidine/phosphomethylpyrimidine kinase
MLSPRPLPVALTIAGSDSGGGAGIQADLKTFAALGVHGTTAITCLTAQNPERVFGVQPCPARMVVQQLEALFDELPPAAAKTGMLYSAAVIRVVSKFFAQRSPGPPLVVDPVMLSGRGTRLLLGSAFDLLKRELLPLATLVTPNVAEAEALSGLALKTIADLRQAARLIQRRFHCAALVKGGHLRNTTEAADIFYDGENELLLSAPRIRGVRTHGTGCTYSAAITANLALGRPLPEAVALAKEYITQAIAHSQLAAGHPVLNSLWNRRLRG